VAGGALAAAVAPGKAATAAGSDPFGEPVLVLPTEKKLPPPQNPYEQLEPFGESFRGKKGPNLQVGCNASRPYTSDPPPPLLIIFCDHIRTRMD
jgi:hypothetical protein